ncbi:MAG: peptidoglycan DD-metalloendopeptidase family protein [Betaproteobacteria bacterium]
MTVVRKSTQMFAVLIALIALLVLAACASKYPLNQAPVEDRGTGSATAAPVAVEPPPVPAKAPPGTENASKPGYYTVKHGDTLIRIGLDSGQNWRDLVRWNRLENPNQIEVGQVLQVSPAAMTAATPETVVVTRPVVGTSVTPVVAGSPPTPARPVSAVAATPAAAPSAVAAPASEEEIAWIWPASGATLRGFDEVNNKGLDLGGKPGDAVLAAMDGRVVYAGAGLRGYGNLIILKHNNTYLSAYAHNQTLLVKEEQNVRKGQKIAEMGSSDAERVALHFEIRRQGKPVDPSKYLPAR